MPSEAYLRDNVYSAASGYQGNLKADLQAAPLANEHRRLIRYLSAQNPTGRVLDVGDSNGALLYAAREQGLLPCGVELNPKTAEVGIRAGLDIFIGTLEKAAFPSNSFDFVHLGDVIEHVPDPRALLEECARVVKPGGSIVIRTPNLDCFWARATYALYRLLGIPWSAATPPHHVYQFSTANLDQLAHQVRLADVTCWFERPPSLKYELGSLHLIRRYKQRGRHARDLLFAYLSFGLYATIYAVDWLVTPLKRSDAALVRVYKK